MDADLELLARLVGDVDRFASTRWGRASVLRPSGTPFDDLLDVGAIERLLLSSARRPSFRLVQDGRTLPPERSTVTVRLGGQRLDDVADLGRIATAVDGGATLVLQGLQRTWLPLAELCRSLERATSHPVQANAYLTPAGAAGLARHHDDHDVLILQVLGSKAWDVDDLGAVTTVPGDVLYIPAETRHEASTQDGMSLHLTLGVLRVTHGQVLRRALEDLPGLDLDRPLPLGYARPERWPELADDLQRTLAGAAAGLQAADPEAVGAREATRARTRRQPLPLGQLAAVLALGDIDGQSVVVRRADHAASIASELAPDGRIVLDLVDRRLHLPPVTRPALVRLLEAEPVTVDDLPGLDPGGRLVLVRRLVREGLLVPDDR
jgi:hypothetical protein